MPTIIEPRGTLEAKTYDYKYPLNNDWRPKSKLHGETMSWIIQRARYARNVMMQRWPIYDSIDEKLTSYIVPDDKGPKGSPSAVVIPISYSVLDTLLTYFMATFGDGPIIQCRPIGPEDRIKAALMELALDHQFRRSKALLALYVQWRDAFAYGLGIVHTKWQTDFGKKLYSRPYGFISDLSGMFVKRGTKVVSKREIISEYNTLENINVRSYFPDPSVPCHKIQDGEFVCISVPTTYATLLEWERQSPEMWFNVRYLSGYGGNRSEFASPNTNLDTISIETLGQDKINRPITLLYCYANIIPKELKVGKSEYPEKWLFCIANDSVIVRAQPLNLEHNMFPIAVACPTFDGYSVGPISSIEVTYEAQLAADKFYKQRMRTLEAVSNVKMIIDPYLARYDDAIDPDKNAIRIRDHVWGRGVDGAAKQLDLHDPLPNILTDISYLNELIQRSTGAVDQMQGVVRPSGERRSATEMRDTRMSAVSRLQKMARLVSLQSMQDMGRQAAINTKQFSSMKILVPLMGGFARELQQIYNSDQATIFPEDLDVEVDITISDATSPGGEFLPDLIQMFQMIESYPETAMAFDATRMVLDLLKRAGVKGASQFLRVTNAAVVPDEQAAEAGAQPGAIPAQEIVTNGQ